jgi:hypothetical protein
MAVGELASVDCERDTLMNICTESCEQTSEFRWECKSSFQRQPGGDRVWAANFVLPVTGPVLRYSWITKMNGDNVFRFVPYDITFNFYNDALNVGISMQDAGEFPVPEEEDGSSMMMFLTVDLATE